MEKRTRKDERGKGTETDKLKICYEENKNMETERTGRGEKKRVDLKITELRLEKVKGKRKWQVEKLLRIK